MSNLLFNEYHFITKKLLDAKTKIDQNNKELLSERIHNQFSELLKTSNDLAQIENRENIEIFDIKMALKSLNRNNLFLQENSFLTENISKDSLKNGEILMTSKEFEGHLSVEKPRSRCLNIHWLSIDGIEPQTVYNASNPKKLLNSKFRLNDEQKEIVLIKKKNSILTKEMERYFKEIIKNLNSDDKKIRKIAFRALSSDKGLEPLTPFFIQHVSKKISKNNDDIDSLKESLRLLSTIIFSDRANTHFYLGKIVPLLLFCSLKPKLANGFEEHISLRDFSAFLLSTVSKKFSSFDIETKIKRSVLSRLLAPKQKNMSLSACYGAISILVLIGYKIEMGQIAEAIIILSLKINLLTESNDNKKSKIAFIVLGALLPLIKNLIDDCNSFLQQPNENDKKILNLLENIRESAGEKLLTANSLLNETFL